MEAFFIRSNPRNTATSKKGKIFLCQRIMLYSHFGMVIRSFIPSAVLSLDLTNLWCQNTGKRFCSTFGVGTKSGKLESTPGGGGYGSTGSFVTKRFFANLHKLRYVREADEPTKSAVVDNFAVHQDKPQDVQLWKVPPLPPSGGGGASSNEHKTMN